MSDNYITGVGQIKQAVIELIVSRYSPYGFGHLTDAVLDVIADKYGVPYKTLAVMLERLPEETTEELNLRIYRWSGDHMNFAIDKLDDLLSEYVDLGAGK